MALRTRFLALFVMVLIAGRGWSNGSVSGHSRIEKISGRPDLGYVELYEYKAFLSPVDSNQTGFSYHCGDPGTAQQPYTGNYWWPSVPNGNWSIFSVHPEFFPRGKVVGYLNVWDGQITVQHALEPVDYSGLFTKSQWDSGWANPVFQTFIARGTSINRVSYVMAGYTDGMSGVRVSVLREVEGLPVSQWPQVGPAKTGNVGSLSDSWVAWQRGEVGTVPGQRYAVCIQDSNQELNRTFSLCWSEDSLYPHGTGYRFETCVPANHDYHIAVFSDSDSTIATLMDEDWQLIPIGYSRGKWAQTFVARGNAFAAACVPASNGVNWSYQTDISIHQHGPSGPRIGPKKRMPSINLPAGMGFIGVSFSPTEAPLNAGETYAIVIDALGGSPLNPCRLAHNYPDGRAYAWDGAQWVATDRDLKMKIFEWEDPDAYYDVGGFNGDFEGGRGPWYFNDGPEWFTDYRRPPFWGCGTATTGAEDDPWFPNVSERPRPRLFKVEDNWNPRSGRHAFNMKQMFGEGEVYAVYSCPIPCEPGRGIRVSGYSWGVNGNGARMSIGIHPGGLTALDGVVWGEKNTCAVGYTQLTAEAAATSGSFRIFLRVDPTDLMANDVLWDDITAKVGGVPPLLPTPTPPPTVPPGDAGVWQVR